jgi:hypothetical protein
MLTYLRAPCTVAIIAQNGVNHCRYVLEIAGKHPMRTTATRQRIAISGVPARAVHV